MHRYIILLVLISLLAWPLDLGRAQSPSGTSTPIPAQVTILSLLPGQAIQGSVSIIGTTAVESFQSAELTFSYAQNPTNTWFFIADSDTPVTSGTLADWDTSTLTDGNYTLRLEVTLQDGNILTAIVSGVRVRNYTAIETATPTPPLPTATPKPGETRAPTATLTSTASPVPSTPTPLPPNPAQLSPLDIVSGLLKGLVIVLAIFAVIGFYILIRNILSR